MSAPGKKWKKIFLTFGIGLLLVVGLLVYLTARWNNLKEDYNIEIIWDYQFPSSISILDFSASQSEEFSIELDSAHLNWSWSSIFKFSPQMSDVYLDGLDFVLISSGSSESSFTLPGIRVQKANISNSSFKQIGQDTVDLRLSQLSINSLDLNQSIDLDVIILSGLDLTFKSHIKDNATITNSSEEKSPFSLQSIPSFHINNIEVQQSRVAWNESFVNDLNLNITELFHDESIGMELRRFNFNLQDTLPVAIDLSQLTMTDDADLQANQVNTQFPGLGIKLSGFNGNIEQNQYKLELDSSYMSFGTLKNVYPDILIAMDPKIPNDSLIRFSGVVSYSSEELAFSNLKVSFLHVTETVVAGRVDLSNELFPFEFSFSGFRTSRADLDQFLLRYFYNDFFLWPSAANGTVTLTGDINNYNIQGTLATPEGPLEVHSLITYNQSNDLYYEIGLSSDSVVVPPIIDYLPVDIPAAQIDLLIQGSINETAEKDTLKMTVHSDEFWLYKYPLQNLDFIYYYNNLYDSIWVTIDNDKVKADFLSAYYSEEISSTPFTGKIYHLIPQLAEKLAPDFKVAGNYSGNYLWNDDQYMQMKFSLDDAHFEFPDGYVFGLKDLAADYTEIDTMTSITLDLGDRSILSGLMNGTYAPPETQDAAVLVASLPDISFTGFIDELDSGFWSRVLKLPIHAEDLDFQINNDSILRVKTQGKYLAYDSYHLDSLNLDILLQRDLKAILEFNEFEAPENGFGMDHSRIEFVSDTSHLLINLDLDLREYGTVKLPILVNANDHQYRLSLDTSREINFLQNPLLVLDDQGLVADKDFKHLEGQLQLVSGITDILLKGQGDHLQLKLDTVRLISVLPDIPNLKLEDGFLHTDLRYYLSDAVKATGDFTIDDLKLEGQEIGRITSNFDYQNEELLINGSIEQDELNADVTFFSGNDSTFTRADFSNFDLSYLKRFLNAQYVDVSGYLDGNIVSSSGQELQTDGILILKDATIRTTDINSSFHLPLDTMTFRRDRLEFNDFQIFDARDKPLNLNGFVQFAPDLLVDLNIGSNSFDLITESNEGLITGDAQAKIDLDLSGTFEKLKIAGDLEILTGAIIRHSLSNLPEFSTTQNTVNFVAFTKGDERINIVENSNFYDLDLNLLVGESEFYIVLDEITQEYVRVTGRGRGKLTTDSQDELHFVGSFESSSGRAFVSPPMISSVNLEIEDLDVAWQGDPYDPIINFQGYNVLNALANQLTRDENPNMVPFQVVFSLNDATMESLNLNMDLQSTDSEVNSFLEGLSADDRSNLAMNLTIFGSFNFGEGAGTGSGGSQLVALSAKKMNELAHRNLKNVDLVFSTSDKKDESKNLTKTEFSYSLGKSFLNNRASISLNGDFGLYMEDLQETPPPSHLLGNITFNYLIKPNEPYRLVLERSESDEGVIDGEITRYKVGLSFQKSYPTILSIFGIKPKEEDEE